MKIEVREHIEQTLGHSIKEVHSLSGGDISEAYLITTHTERFFCKIHHGAQSLEMFQKEHLGLETLEKTKTIGIPKVFGYKKLDQGAFLLMKYIETKPPTEKDLEKFGFLLAALHQGRDAPTFGFTTNNFIGSLPQSNHRHADWVNFFLFERLLPQLKLAQDSGRLYSSEVPSASVLSKRLNDIFPIVHPSLLHGDLWNGNFLISCEGEPFLIDPAVYFGHCEIDLAMTRLFGGFGNRFYDAYHEIIPKETGERERIDVYQLYYLLIHLNLFGTSYKSSVNHILQRYFH